MKIERSGSAVWQGRLKDGKGAVSTQSGALDNQPYGFASRFEAQAGTNPEELIAAAHSACFTMALSMILGEAKLVATNLQTTAHVTLESVEDGFAITTVHLVLKANVPGVDQETFHKLATAAKLNCPVSKLLNAKISLAIELNTAP